MSFELASAYVRIFVEDSAVNRSLGNIRNNIAGTTTSIQKGMAGVRTGLSGTMTQLNRGIIQFTRNFKKVSAPILSVAKWYMAAVTGLATKALHALYGDDSKAGRAWKKTFDVFKIRLNTEMARIANILLKVPIFGNTIPQWMDKLINFLRSMDLTKIKEMVKLFERAAYVIAGIKAVSIIGNVAAGLTGVGRILERRSAARGAARGVGESVAYGAAAGASGIGTWQALIRLDKAMRGIESIGYNFNKYVHPGETQQQLPFLKEVSGNLKQLWAISKTRSQIERIPFTGAGSMQHARGFEGIANTIQANKAFQDLGPIVKSMRVLGTISTFFTTVFKYILLPFEALSGLLTGFGFKFSSALSLIWFLIKKLGTAFLMLLEVLSIPFRAFRAGFESIGIIMRNIFTGSFQQMANELTSMWQSMIDSIGTRLGNLWTPLNVAENQETYATKRRNLMEGLIGSREKFGGSYIGLTEGVKFAQDIARKDNEYLKEIAASTKQLAVLAKG